MSNSLDQQVGMSMMDMRMYMIINWDYRVRFIFNNWKTTSYGEFIFALILTFLFCILLCALQVLKGFAEQKKSIALKILWQLLMSIQSSITMILLMTVNGWVFLSMAFGFGVGNFILYPFMPVYKNHIKQDQVSLNKLS